MNDSQFESSLRALRPSAPPAALEERIETALSALSAPEPSPLRKEREPVSIRFEQAREPLLIRCFHSLGWAIAGAASAVAVIALYPSKPASEKPETSSPRASAQIDERALTSAPSADAGSPAAPGSTIPVAAHLPAGSGATAP